MMQIGPTRFTYYKQDGFEVWGKQYQDSAGAVSWRLRVFSEQDRRIETYEDVTVEPPEGTRTGESEAMRKAIAAWLASALAPGNDVQHANAGIDAPPIPEAMTVVETASLPEDELRLNEEERKSLSPRARAYIQYLEQEVSRTRR
jgi:DNA-binding transcriptional LysR family regulator